MLEQDFVCHDVESGLLQPLQFGVQAGKGLFHDHTMCGNFFAITRQNKPSFASRDGVADLVFYFIQALRDR